MALHKLCALHYETGTTMFIFVFYMPYAIENDEFDMNRLATAPRPGTTLRTETSTASAMYQMPSNRPKTLGGRPLSGMVL